MTGPKIVMCACAALLMFSSVASAQRWGHERQPKDGVCFYRDIDFRGEYFCVAAGDELPRMPADMNDRISSFRIFGRAEVTVYRDPRFGGRSAHFDRNVRDLRRDNWNDTISSLEVHSYRNGAFDRGHWVQDRGRDPRDADRIVRRAYQDVLGREPDPAGLRQFRSRIIDDGWTEKQVRDALRDSSEYRKVAVDRAREVVRRAYLSVLKREPDAGSSGFVEKVLRQNWTQSDVERELRKSPEYRRR
jgi:hypothetical protein